ncbi:hypothetical protein [Streptomyces brevispora]
MGDEIGAEFDGVDPAAFSEDGLWAAARTVGGAGTKKAPRVPMWHRGAFS